MIQTISERLWPQPSLIDRLRSGKFEVTKSERAAARALAELGATYGLHAAVGVAVAATASMHLAMSFMTMACFSLVVRPTLLWLQGYKPAQVNTELEGVTQRAQKTAQFSLWTLLGAAGPVTAIHESGHAFMGMALLKGADPTISFSPFKGGYTDWGSVVQPRRIAQFLGYNSTRVLVLAAGVLATTLVACAAIACANRCRESLPTLSKHLELIGYAVVLPDILYGIQSITDVESLGDFCEIQQITGCHPLILVASIIAMIAAVKFLAPAEQRPLSWTQRMAMKGRALLPF